MDSFSLQEWIPAFIEKECKESTMEKQEPSDNEHIPFVGKEEHNLIKTLGLVKVQSIEKKKY